MSADQLITDHLDLWTSAVTHKSGRGAAKGRELTGIKKLRELILELAVRGRLVEQDPNDEPASVLLERIAGEKYRLVQEGEAKKPKKLPEISDEDTPFRLPTGWAWTRTGMLFDVVYGKGLPASKLTEEGYDVFGANGIIGKYTEYTYSKPQLLISCRGAYSGKANLSRSKCFITSNTLILQNTWQYLSLKYFYYYYSAANKEKIVTGTAQPQVTTANLDPFLIAVPPFSEQHRIVDKVDELMALCDRLEQQTGDQLDAHEVLVDTLLDALTRAENADEVAAQWARLAEHFDTLFTTEASIDKLKQAILQLAVMGRLVEQDPDDEPASVLVNAIIDERNRLKDQEGMRTKASDNIDEDELYFSAPTHWNWIKLGNTAKFIDYRGRTPNKTKSGRRLITAKNIRQGYIDLCPEEFISDEDYLSWMTRGFPRVGDTLFTTEAPLGNVANIDIQEEFALAQRAICFQWHLECISEFMLLQLMASAFQKQLEENSNGMTATGIKSAKLKEIPVVLPPISEQHRIVARFCLKSHGCYAFPVH